MTAQDMFVQAATISFIGAVLVVALLMGRRGLVAPLVAFGAAVLIARAGGFAINYFFASEGEVPVALQAPQTWARTAPIVALTIYVCLMQVRRYRAARNNGLIRWLFRRALKFYGAFFVLMVAWDCVVQPPLLEYDTPYPVASWAVETAWHATDALYAWLAAFVFFKAVTGTLDPSGLGPRLQNLFFGIALLGAGTSSPIVVTQRGFRAFFPQETTEALAQWFAVGEFVTFVATIGGIVLGIFSYYYQSRSDRFLERFSSFLELVGDLTEEIAAVSIGGKGVNLSYAAMHQAAGEGFLELSSADKLRMDNAFCGLVVLGEKLGGPPGEEGARAGRMGRRRLRDLANAYDAELKEPVLREGLTEGVCGQAMPDVVVELLPEQNGVPGLKGSPGRRWGMGEALALVLEAAGTEEGVAERRGVEFPEWGQLAHVALADAGHLPARQAEAVLNGRGMISERVLNAYRLAEYKLRNHGDGAPGIFYGERE